MRMQVYGCGALCAAGMTAGGLAAIGELGFHLASLRDTIGWVGATLAGGAALGFWLPRRVIHRRLAATGAAPPDGVAFEFASSAIGVLVLLLAVLWALLHGWLAGLESIRGWLTAHFVQPPAVTLAWLIGPAAVLLMLIGAVAAIGLVALHGWFRLVSGARRSLVRLWIVLLAGAGVAAALVAWLSPAGGAGLLCLVSVFIAGLLVVSRKPLGHAEELAALAPPQRPPSLTTSLVLGALSCAALALALVPAVAPGPPAVGRLALALASLAAALAAGVATAWTLVRLADGTTWWTPLTLLVVAVTVLLPRGDSIAAPWGDGLRIVLMAFAVALCVTLVAIDAQGALVRPQRALAWVGITIGATLAAAALLGGVSDVAFDGRVATVLMALGLILAAGLALLFDHGAPVRFRAGGLAGVGMVLLGLLYGQVRYDGAAEAASAVPGSTPQALPACVLDALIERRAARVFAGPEAASDAMVWQCDLRGRAWEVIILARDTTADHPPHALRRLLQRCARAVLPGGQVVIDRPLPVVRRLVAAWQPRSASLLRVTCNQQQRDLLVLGTAAEAWFDGLPLPDGVIVESQPLRTAR